MTTAQLELPFMTQDPQMRLIKYLEDMQERFDRNRKCQFAKISSNTKEIDEIKHELAILKAVMCKGQLEFNFNEHK